jgi:hypothetical protein
VNFSTASDHRLDVALKIPRHNTRSLGMDVRDLPPLAPQSPMEISHRCDENLSGVLAITPQKMFSSAIQCNSAFDVRLRSAPAFQGM